MTRRWTVVLALLAGLALGYAAREIPLGAFQNESTESEAPDSEEPPSDSPSAQPSEPAADTTTTAVDSPAPEAFPASRALLEYILPTRALAQVRIHVAEIREGKSEEDIGALLSRRVTQEMFLRMSENARPSFGPLISALAANAETLHLFLLPQEAEIPVPTLLVMAEWPDAGYVELRRCLREPLLEDLEDAEAYSEPLGEFTLEGVRAPTGNASYVVTDESVWICNSRKALAEFFTMEPPSEPQGSPPLESLFAQVPQDPVVAAFNLRPDTGGRAGPAGILAFLAGLGIDRVALGWGGTPATLAAFGTFKERPAWAQEWAPLNASDLRGSAAGSLAVLHASLPPMPSMDQFGGPMMGGFGQRGRGQEDRTGAFPDEGGVRSRGGRNREDRAGAFPDEGGVRSRGGRNREDQAGAFPGEGGFRSREARGDRGFSRADSRRGGGIFRMMALSRMLPPAQTISIRLAPGEQDPVVWRITFRGEAEKFATWAEGFESGPWVQIEEAGPNLQRWGLEGGPMSRMVGVEQVWVANQGDSLAVYSSEEASRLLSSPSGSAGEIVMESASGGSAEQPQVYANLSSDFLHLLVAGEKASLDTQSPNGAKIAEFLDALAAFTSATTLDLTVLPDGIRARARSDHPMAAALGPVFVASALLRGGI